MGVKAEERPGGRWQGQVWELCILVQSRVGGAKDPEVLSMVAWLPKRAGILTYHSLETLLCGQRFPTPRPALKGYAHTCQLASMLCLHAK